MKWLAALRASLAESDWLRILIGFASIVGLGILLGHQYVFPDKRVLAVAAAIIIFGIAWRVDLVTAVGLLLAVIPFPRYTIFGSTTIAFVLLLTIVWLLRASQREAPGLRRTPADAPIVGLMLAYFFSFYNVRDPVSLESGLRLTVVFLACVLIFYLIASNVRTEAQLRRLHVYQAVSIALIHLFCYWELAFPGTYLVPGWIDLRGINEASFQVRNYRVGGPWIDYELLSEFAALNIVFFVFLVAQARTTSRRVFYIGMLLSSTTILFATVTRGGIVALAVGLGYLLFRVRRRLNALSMTLIAGITAITLGVLSFALRHLTVAGDLFARLTSTQFVGLTPDSRTVVWPQAWERWMRHPIIGWGPYYEGRKGLDVWYWPHSLPLLLGNCFGIIGLSMFAWFMWKLWKVSSPRTDRIDDPNYAKAMQLCTHVQLFIFLVDQLKIEYLRNINYSYQPWILFASVMATGLIARKLSEAPEPSVARVPAAVPARA